MDSSISYWVNQINNFTCNFFNFMSERPRARRGDVTAYPTMHRPKSPREPQIHLFLVSHTPVVSCGGVCVCEARAGSDRPPAEDWRSTARVSPSRSSRARGKRSASARVSPLCLKLMSKENNDAGWRLCPRPNSREEFLKGLRSVCEVTHLLSEMPSRTRICPETP